MTCPECHEPIRRHVRRCATCGYRLDSGSVALPAAVDDPSLGRSASGDEPSPARRDLPRG